MSCYLISCHPMKYVRIGREKKKERETKPNIGWVSIWHQIGPVHLHLTLWNHRIQAWLGDPEPSFPAHSPGGPRCARSLRAGSGPGELGVGADVAILHCPEPTAQEPAHAGLCPRSEELSPWAQRGPCPGPALQGLQHGPLWQMVALRAKLHSGALNILKRFP